MSVAVGRGKDARICQGKGRRLLAIGTVDNLEGQVRTTSLHTP